LQTVDVALWVRVVIAKRYLFRGRDPGGSNLGEKLFRARDAAEDDWRGGALGRTSSRLIRQMGFESAPGPPPSLRAARLRLRA